MTGRIIGNYRVIAKLGEGGMGKVYRAVDSMVEREVALKSLKPEIAGQPGVIDRFRSEAVLLARLNHPAIAQLYAFFKDGDDYYMVMEYVAGETLEAVIRRDGPMPWNRAIGYATQILEGLSHAHSLGVLHRDLKPANIILTSAGKAKVMDFGIARALGAAGVTREGRIIGTLEYLAPERAQGKPADVRSDVYSAGIVLYEMVTGRLPFQSDSEYELLMAQVHQPPPPPSSLGIDLPPEVERAILKALEKDPDQRYADAAAFSEALLAIAPATPNPPIPGPTAKPAAPRINRKLPRYAAVVAVAAVLLIAGVATTLMRPKHPATPPVAAAEPASGIPPEPQPAAPVIPLPGTIPGSAIPLPEAPPPQVAHPAPAAAEKPVVAGHARPSRPAKQSAEPPVPAGALPAIAPEVRRAALAALDQTDGPAEGEPGAHPIHLTGLVAALRIGGAPVTPDVDEAVARRGVNFVSTPVNQETLRRAGADDEMLRLVASNYRAAAPPPRTETPAPRAEPLAPKEKPAPAMHRAAYLSDVHSLYVEPTEDDLSKLVRQELGKQLGSRLKLADSAASADGIMRITLESPDGGKIAHAGRILGIKDRALVRASIVAPGSTHPIWEQSAGDRKPVIGAFHGESLKRLAERIVKDLKDDLR